MVYLSRIAHSLRNRLGLRQRASIMPQCRINRWLVRTKEASQLNHLHLSDDERTGHLPKLIDDMIARLSRPKLPGQDSDAIASPAAVEHGNNTTFFFTAELLNSRCNTLNAVQFCSDEIPYRALPSLRGSARCLRNRLEGLC